MDQARLASARAALLRVLQGELTPESDVAYFEEDVFYFDVSFVERHDQAWLYAQLQSEGFQLERRLGIAIHLYSGDRHRILDPLMAAYQRGRGGEDEENGDGDG